MELRQLRYFLAVAEELNFTRAAARVGIAQPPLSMQISGLERELGAALFTRTKRKVALTAAGEALVVHARRVINTTQQAAEIVRAIANGEEGSLSIGAIFSSIYTLVPDALRSFTADHPTVDVRLQEMTVAQQILALHDGRIDLGIMRGPVSDPDLETAVLFSEPFVAAIPADHPLARQARVSPEEFASEPLISISPAANLNFSARMVGMFVERDQSLRIVQEVADMHTLLGLVGAGLGVSVVPASLQSIRINQVVYRPFTRRTPSTIMQLAWHKGSASQTLPAFVAAAHAAAEKGMAEMFAVQPEADEQALDSGR
ncbi:MAG: LysR substrate-binding domain-containing protein [Aquisalimonadaceae bacterium]